LREAAITSLPGDSGQSFKDAVVDSVIDMPAWESCLISSSTNSNTPSAMTAQRTRMELRELVKFERGLIVLPKSRMWKKTCFVGMRRGEAEEATTQSTCVARTNHDVGQQQEASSLELRL
jgi:hypothetical protein